MQSFQVPQYIEEESRLIGSFTFSQITILVLGGGIIYLAYALLASWISLIVIMFVGAGTVILAFVQVDGMPTYKLIMPLIRHLWLPKTYIWRKPELGSTLSSKSLESIKMERTQPIIQKPVTKKKINISDLSSMLNKGDKKL